MCATFGKMLQQEKLSPPLYCVNTPLRGQDGKLHSYPTRKERCKLISLTWINPKCYHHEALHKFKQLNNYEFALVIVIQPGLEMQIDHMMLVT